MAFNDTFRLSSHGVITNEQGQILQLKANYGNSAWGLPGGALEPGETIHEALMRECREELGLEVNINYLSGVYYHSHYQSQAFIFRCELPQDAEIKLSEEHSEFHFFEIHDLSAIQRQRVEDCLKFDGVVKSAKF
ncbi:NUDIX hydrolase [Shewanella acanthi]|uniref:NUDIX hydrolase n=1 Tax=Shewanella acanthi TaxID=2864212 RepID=UPI001C65F6E9|nr:NUDIX domain-containing protein [Shewanella acanthi]QYJ79207.1 NUDIX domain-containing protein [Shewanella acanthi]